MLRKSLMIDQALVYLTLLPKDRHRCKWISVLVIFQCLFVFTGAISVLFCYWSPQKTYFENEKLARIMYLYDYQACGYTLESAREISNLRLPNETYGGNILPIAWTAAKVTVSTRLSAKTRKYIELSVGIHCIWMAMALALWTITRSSNNINLLKFMLMLFLFTNIFVVMFDVSMAIVYVAHLQQSSTKGMVVRYSGWSVYLRVENPDEFAGWLPLLATFLWLRGVVLLFWNIYCCKLIYHMRSKIKRQEVSQKVMKKSNLPIPDANPELERYGHALYYRAAIICMIISYIVLGCNLPPRSQEHYELTLMKLLYLYEPASCQHTYFYNFTGNYGTFKQIYSNIVWSVQNPVAQNFREKLKIWLTLHIIWTLLAFANLLGINQPYKFYMVNLPFTATGVAMLLVDIVCMSCFLSDCKYTKNEVDLFEYINNGENLVKALNSTIMQQKMLTDSDEKDLSWISLVMAYCSSRAIVQWIINFWMIEDNFLEGLESFRRFQHQKNGLKRRPANLV